MGCQFNIAWVGKCDNPTVGESDYCLEHNHVECSSCGQQATHECHQTMGPLVCGSPLCDKCEHEIAEDGTNGMTISHCRKDEQKHKPWYARSDK